MYICLVPKRLENVGAKVLRFVNNSTQCNRSSHNEPWAGFSIFHIFILKIRYLDAIRNEKCSLICFISRTQVLSFEFPNNCLWKLFTELFGMKFTAEWELQN